MARPTGAVPRPLHRARPAVHRNRVGAPGGQACPRSSAGGTLRVMTATRDPVSRRRRLPVLAVRRALRRGSNGQRRAAEAVKEVGASGDPPAARVGAPPHRGQGLGRPRARAVRRGGILAAAVAGAAVPRAAGQHRLPVRVPRRDDHQPDRGVAAGRIPPGVRAERRRPDHRAHDRRGAPPWSRRCRQLRLPDRSVGRLVGDRDVREHGDHRVRHARPARRGAAAGCWRSGSTCSPS